VDSGDQRSGRTVWDPHRLSQSPSTMTKLSSSPQDRTQEIVSPIKTELSISQGPLLCSSGIGPASVEASLPFSSASSSAYCSVSSSGRTIGPIPELGDQSFMRSCCLQGEATMLDQGGISSPVCTPPVQGTQGRLSGIVDAPMSLPHHILHRSNPVPQPSTLASHLGSPCLPVSPVYPSIPAVVSPYIPPVYPNYPGPPMGPPFPSQESRLPFRVQPPCLPSPAPSSWSITRTLPLPPPVNGPPASERFPQSALESRMSTSPLGLKGARLEAEFPALVPSAPCSQPPVTPVSGVTSTGLPRVLKNKPDQKKCSFSGSIHDMKITF